MKKYRLIYCTQFEKQHEHDDGLGPRLEYEFEEKTDDVAYQIVRGFINELPRRVFIELHNIVNVPHDVAVRVFK